MSKHPWLVLNTFQTSVRQYMHRFTLTTCNVTYMQSNHWFSIDKLSSQGLHTIKSRCHLGPTYAACGHFLPGLNTRVCIYIYIDHLYRYREREYWMACIFTYHQTVGLYGTVPEFETQFHQIVYNLFPHLSATIYTLVVHPRNLKWLIITINKSTKYPKITINGCYKPQMAGLLCFPH